MHGMIVTDRQKAAAIAAARDTIEAIACVFACVFAKEMYENDNNHAGKDSSHRLEDETDNTSYR